EVFSGGKEAHGDILMIPPESNIKVPSPEETIRTMPQVLEINFIQAAGNEISGTVGPYEDRDAPCHAHSIFKGTMSAATDKAPLPNDGSPPSGGPGNSSPFTSGTWHVPRTRP